MSLPATTEPKQHTQDEMEILASLINYGPMLANEIQRTCDVAELLAAGLVAHIVVRCESGFIAATYEGMRVFCSFYENANTMVKAVEACRDVIIRNMRAGITTAVQV